MQKIPLIFATELLFSGSRTVHSVTGPRQKERGQVPPRKKRSIGIGMGPQSLSKNRNKTDSDIDCDPDTDPEMVMDLRRHAVVEASCGTAKRLLHNEPVDSSLDSRPVFYCDDGRVVRLASQVLLLGHRSLIEVVVPGDAVTLRNGNKYLSILEVYTRNVDIKEYGDADGVCRFSAPFDVKLHTIVCFPAGTALIYECAFIDRSV